MNYPHVCQDDGKLTVDFAPRPTTVKCLPLWMNLDFDGLGGVVGIEIVNLISDTHQNALDTIVLAIPTIGQGLTQTYDEECDCFYLRLSTRTSRDQKRVGGQAYLDGEGRLVALHASWAM